MRKLNFRYTRSSEEPLVRRYLRAIIQGVQQQNLLILTGRCEGRIGRPWVWMVSFEQVGGVVCLPFATIAKKELAEGATLVCRWGLLF